ncbi:MAG: putative peroxiredoxin [Glaciecola sp.]|jgi:predicted peroxiredoxin
MADEPLLFTCSHGPEDPERATVPFILAATAAIAGQKVIVVCTVDGSWMGTDRISEVEEDGFPPAADLRKTLIEAGGEVWVCGACASKRKITGDDTSDGCTIVGAATIVEALVNGKAFTAA